MTTSQDEMDTEILAIASVYNALKELTPDEQARVLDYVQRKLRRELPQLSPSPSSPFDVPVTSTPDAPSAGGSSVQQSASEVSAIQNGDPPPDTDESGINSVALKWMQRNGLTVEGLGQLFSLGLDDIELVAKSVPGKSKRERMHSVALLKCIAAYLGSGAARISHAELKEACLHYDAYDVANSTAYMKAFATEIGGSAKQGYTLSARGLAAATDLVKELVAK